MIGQPLGPGGKPPEGRLPNLWTKYTARNIVAVNNEAAQVSILHEGRLSQCLLNMLQVAGASVLSRVEDNRKSLRHLIKMGSHNR